MIYRELETITDAENVGLKLLANRHALAKYLLVNLEQTVNGIGLNVNR